LTIIKWATQYYMHNQQVKFLISWSTSILRDYGDNFHMTFQASFQVYAQGFQVVNIGNSFSV
jgi:hypothetical protein